MARDGYGGCCQGVADAGLPRGMQGHVLLEFGRMLRGEYQRAAPPPGASQRPRIGSNKD